MLVCGTKLEQKLGHNNLTPDVNSKYSLLPPSIVSGDVPTPPAPAGILPVNPGTPAKLPPEKSLVICSCKFGK